MYFTPQAKERREDFFNYEKELERVRRAMEEKPLTVVKGPRRVGKTSLLRVAYNLYKGPKAWMNGFLVRNEGHFWEVLYLKLKEIIVASSLKRRIADLLTKVEIKGVRLSNKMETVEEILEKEKISGVLVIDEAQLLAKYGLSKWLAYAYDHLSLHILLSGSQVGVMEKMLGEGKKAESPLKGRAIEEISLSPLTFAKAQVFLIEGMSQIGKKIREDEIEEVYNAVGGLIGWLTYYGYYRQEGDHAEALEKVKERAREITLEELEHLKEATDESYLIVLNGIAKGFNTWKAIKNYALVYHSLPLSDSALKRRLDKLMELSWIEKKDRVYRLCDPLVKEGLKVFFP